jgi:hypothetical protein
MKRSILLMIGILTFCGAALIGSSARAIDGPLANATVSFGQWNPNDSRLVSPLDRLLGDPDGGVGNNHELFPQTATIAQGGSVSFIISGGHVIAVYDDGTQPEDVNRNVTEAATNCPTSAGGVISDPAGRIYRGPCFSTNVGTTPPTTIVRRDGVEVVQFEKPGTYLVICARRNHFFNPTSQQFEMFGFVKVLPRKGQ